MLYLLAKLIAKFSFLAIYRKVYIINEDNVPGDRAVLITCNHPNGFVEPLVIGGYIPHQIYFLVRGDVFKSKWANYLLRGIHCIPIFRFRDGFASMRKNNESINDALDILSKKKPLLIFAEGSTAQVRYVRPIQKGTIRLAFDTLKNAPESNPCIVPSVIHFSDPMYYRSEVIMEYGAPIEVKKYESLYDTHKAKAIKKLLDDVNNAMQDISIRVDPSVDKADADDVLDIARSITRDPNVYPIIKKVNTSLQRDSERKAGKIFSNLSKQDQSNLITKIKDLKNQLTKSGVEFSQVSGKTKSSSFNLILLILGFIPAIIGRVLNLIPIALAQGFARTKIKKPEFKAVIKLCSFLIMYPIYIFFLSIVLSFLSWKIGLAIFALPILGWFSYLYQGQLKEEWANWKFGQLNEKTKENLKVSYQEVLVKLNINIGEYK